MRKIIILALAIVTTAFAGLAVAAPVFATASVALNTRPNFSVSAGWSSYPSHPHHHHHQPHWSRNNYYYNAAPYYQRPQVVYPTDLYSVPPGYYQQRSVFYNGTSCNVPPGSSIRYTSGGMPIITYPSGFEQLCY